MSTTIPNGVKFQKGLDCQDMSRNSGAASSAQISGSLPNSNRGRITRATSHRGWRFCLVSSALSSRLPRMRNAPSPICTTCSRKQQTSRRRHDERTARFASTLAGPSLSGDQQRGPRPLSAARRPACALFARPGYREPPAALPAFASRETNVLALRRSSLCRVNRGRCLAFALRALWLLSAGSALTFPVGLATRKLEELKDVCGDR